MDIKYKNNNDSWMLINGFLQKERDAIFSALTHANLAFNAGLIIAILLCAISILSPLATFLEANRERSQNFSNSRVDPLSGMLIFSFAVTALMILLLIFIALRRLQREFQRSMLAELKNRANAIETACMSAEIEMPLETRKLLNTFDYYKHSANDNEENTEEITDPKD